MVYVLIFENISLAFSAIVSNKMRSFLTMLGIIIGIGSVIAIVTVGNSLTNSITSSMESMGANNITVSLQQKSTEDESTGNGMVFRGMKRQRAYTDSDYITTDMLYDFVAQFPDEVKDISISESLGSGQVTMGKNYAYVSVAGVNSGCLTSNNLEMLSGSTLSDKALTGGKGVALVSDYFVDNLYDGDTEKAIGEQVEVVIGRSFYQFTIVGVYKYEASAMVTTSKTDTTTNMYVPLKAVERLNHRSDKYTSFTVIANSGIDSESFCTKIERFFDRYYRKNEYFEVGTFSLESMVSTLTDMLSTVSIAISVIAGISLLVGGIGVMNIMMVSISERTREIGTRKALGATNGSIRLQFIMEAMVLCLVGGVFGVIIGIVGGALGAKMLGYEASASITSIVVSLVFSLAIGVFFGFYPANKAAKMNPIDALRYE